MPAVLIIRLLEKLPNVMVVAIMPMTQMKEIGLGVAAIVTLFGVRLCWLAPHRRMSIEEQAKDGNLTEDQARRKIDRLKWFGPMVTIVGVLLLCAVLTR